MTYLGTIDFRLHHLEHFVKHVFKFRSKWKQLGLGLGVIFVVAWGNLLQTRFHRAASAIHSSSPVSPDTFFRFLEGPVSDSDIGRVGRYTVVLLLPLRTVSEIVYVKCGL